MDTKEIDFGELSRQLSTVIDLINTNDNEKALLILRRLIEKYKYYDLHVGAILFHERDVYIDKPIYKELIDKVIKLDNYINENEEYNRAINDELPHEREQLEKQYEELTLFLKEPLEEKIKILQQKIDENKNKIEVIEPEIDKIIQDNPEYKKQVEKFQEVIKRNRLTSELQYRSQ